MDSFITWEGIVATAALVVSLYNLKQTRKAPARARQRELWDQMRSALDATADQLEGIREGMRAGVPLEDGSKLGATAERLYKLDERLLGNAGRAALVAAKLQKVQALVAAVGVARYTLKVRDFAREHGVAESLPAADVRMAVADVDKACEEALVEVRKVLKELTALETS